MKVEKEPLITFIIYCESLQYLFQRMSPMPTASIQLVTICIIHLEEITRVLNAKVHLYWIGEALTRAYRDSPWIQNLTNAN